MGRCYELNRVHDKQAVKLVYTATKEAEVPRLLYSKSSPTIGHSLLIFASLTTWYVSLQHALHVHHEDHTNRQ